MLKNFIKKDRFQKIINTFPTLSPIAVLGDVGVDKYTYGDVRRISPEAPVPVLEVSKEWEKLGLAANVSDNLKSLGMDSTLCSVIGNDQRANRLESLLEERSLKIWGLIRDASRPTTYKERVTTSTQQICRIDYESKVEIDGDIKRRILHRLQEFVQNHSALIIEDYGKGLLSEDLCQQVIQLFKSQNKIIAVDPSRQTPPLWYKGSTILKPNRIEAELMVHALGYKEKNVEKMATILVDKISLEKIVITLGAEGMAMLDTKEKNTFEIIPTVANEVFDVSGAGDTAISAITASLLSSGSLFEAACIGNCAAGVVVKKHGTALCSIDELTEFYQVLEKKFLN